MSRHYKEINNGNGTNLTISEGRYLSVEAAMEKLDRVIDDFVDAIDITKSVWARDDNANAAYEHGNRYSMEEQK